MVVLGNFFLIMALFLIQDIIVLESASSSKRVIYQTFFDNNLFLTCYGTCSHSLNGFASAMRNFRCEGNKVRLKCNRGYVIRVSFAFYGELEAGQEVCKDVSSLFEQCRKDVSAIVVKDCNGKGLCLFSVDHQRFGKFCRGQYFYLDIRHSCEARPSTTGNTESTTSSNGYETTQLQTTKKTTKVKPITIYKDGRPISTRTNIGTREQTTQGSTTNLDSTSHTSASHSSSSAAATHVPISRAGGSTNEATRQNGVTVSKGATILPTRRFGRSSGKKASLYWLLTAHSLVTDDGFIKANSTHLVLAVILSVFIALVICTCFLLDHSRRQARKRSRKQPHEEGGGEDEAPMENGSPAGYDLLHGHSSLPKSHRPPLVTNGNAKRFSTRSLDEFNHNTGDGGEFLPLIPISAQSLSSINHEGNKEASQIFRSSLLDNLPPPPEELLLESPRGGIAGYLDDNESEASTVSIPPPIGFTDADVINKSTPNLKAEFQTKSPSPESSSGASSYRTLPNSSKGLGPKIDNLQRLNNEFSSEISAVSHDSNLLHNSVSVQTNDLREISDKRSRVDNSGHVSMKSPFLEVSDAYATVDDISKVTETDFEEFGTSDVYGMKGSPVIDGYLKENDTVALKCDSHKLVACTNDAIQSSKRGKLIVIKSPKEKSTDIVSSGVKLDTSEAKCSLIENNSPIKKELSDVSTMNARNERTTIGGSKIKGVYLNGSTGLSLRNNRPLEDSSGKSDEKEDHTASASSVDSDSSVLQRYDSASKQLLFAVPKHRCGTGHSHKCACVPLRTGNSSFICSCLENAKHKSSKCCMENCPEGQKSTGVPYSSQRSFNWRMLATDIPKRKIYNSSSVKRASSLEQIDNIPGKFVDVKKSCRVDDKGVISSRSSTLPHLQSKLKKANVTSSGTKTLDRVHWASKPSTLHDSKLLPIIVHSTRNKQAPRFEKRTDSFEDNMKSVIHSDACRSNRSDDSDSSDRSGSTEGRSMSLPTTPIEKRRKKNGHHRLSPISENASKKPITQEQKPWPKRSPRFKVQVVESAYYDKKKRVNEI